MQSAPSRSIATSVYIPQTYSLILLPGEYWKSILFTSLMISSTLFSMSSSSHILPLRRTSAISALTFSVKASSIFALFSASPKSLKGYWLMLELNLALLSNFLNSIPEFFNSQALRRSLSAASAFLLWRLSSAAFCLASSAFLLASFAFSASAFF